MGSEWLKTISVFYFPVQSDLLMGGHVTYLAIESYGQNLFYALRDSNLSLH